MFCHPFVKFVAIGLNRHSRSRREHDHHAIDDDAIGTGFARGLANLGEGAPLALPSRCHRLRRGLDQLQLLVVAGLKVGRRRPASCRCDFSLDVRANSFGGSW
jgi:hypothetical protein